MHHTPLCLQTLSCSIYIYLHQNTAPNATATNKSDRLNTNTKIIIASRVKEVKKEREYKVRDEEGMVEYEEGEGG